VAVLRPDGSRAEPGETGEVCMRGHNVMTGYRGNPQATREAFRGGWFHSGDLGHEVRVPGYEEPFFVLSGRTKNIAKVRGQAVSLEEMERVLLAVPGVADAGCVALPHQFFGEQVTAAVVLRSTAEPIDVLPALRAAFPAGVLPERVVELPAIPRTPTGKLRRAELKSLLTAP
jgi:acyl-CoA synthetase (AMP-forming)/AMP-acid ligase II